MGLAFILDNNSIHIYIYTHTIFRYPIFLVSLSKSRRFVVVVVVDTSFLMLTSSAFLHHLFFDHRGYAFRAEHGGLFGCGAKSGALASGEDGD